MDHALVNKELTQLLLDLSDHLEEDGDSLLLQRVQDALNGAIQLNGCKICSQWEEENRSFDKKIDDLEKKMQQDCDEYAKEAKKLQDRLEEKITTLNRIRQLAQHSGYGQRKGGLRKIRRLASGQPEVPTFLGGYY